MKKIEDRDQHFYWRCETCGYQTEEKKKTRENDDEQPPRCTLAYGVASTAHWSSHLEFFMSKRILVVDDNAPIRGIVRELIESRPGFEVCGEATRLEGIEKGRELKPDLIVMDFLMPGINGLQAAVVLHEIVPNTPIIPFWKRLCSPALSTRGCGRLK